MSDNDNGIVSVDEYCAERKAVVRDDGAVMKSARSSPSTWNKEKRTCDFTMSAEIEDRDRDIILQAGLNIERFIGDNPVALPMHSYRSMPIGKWSNVTKNLTGRPKRTEGTLNLMPEGASPAADEIAVHLDFGTIRACSIGFIPNKVKRRKVPEDKQDEPYYYAGYMIEEAELLECSVVNIPSNPAALAKHAALGNVYAKEMIEEVLDNWAKHPETGLLIPRSQFEEAAKTASNKRVTITMVGSAGEKTTFDGPDSSTSKPWFSRLWGPGTTSAPEPKTALADPPEDEKAAAEKARKLQELKDGIRIALRKHELAKQVAAAEARART